MAESKDILQIGIETIVLESKSLNKLSTLLDVNFSNVVNEIILVIKFVIYPQKEN